MKTNSIHRSIVVSSFIFLLLGAGAAHGAVNGFNNGSNWQTNTTGSGPAVFSGNSLTITTVNDSGNNSAFYAVEQPTAHFTAQFTYTDAANGNNGGDGSTFAIQSDPRGDTAVAGLGGSAMGYASPNQITNSIAVEFHLDPVFNAPVGTGLGTEGNLSSSYITTGSVNLHSGDPINVTLAYNGTTLSETLVDALTSASFSTSYTVSIPSLVGSQGYVGFTGGSGLDTSTQVISNFSFLTPEPASWVMLVIGGVGFLARCSATIIAAGGLADSVGWNQFGKPLEAING